MAGPVAKYKTWEAADVKRITALQTHDNCDISILATRLIETFCRWGKSLSLSLCTTCYLLCLNDSCFHVLNSFLL